MPKYNGKFQKNQSKNKNRLFLAVGIFATCGEEWKFGADQNGY